jgi:DNA-binding beta-propeller fold protein YncE
MRPAPGRGGRAALAALGLLAIPMAVSAGVILPAGFAERVYVSGQGFDRGSEPGSSGVPVATTLGVDATGHLYLAKSGSRYGAGQTEEFLSRVYRIPPGGARLTPQTEGRFLHGPPLVNAQVSGGREGRHLFVTTFDRDRRVGVLYRLADGRTNFLAGGTPAEPARAPLLIQPEGVATSAAGDVYVADRDRGVVLRLDGDGRMLDNVRIQRPRALTVDETDHLWIGSDGNAEAPWQAGPGAIWRVSPRGEPRLVLEGPVAQGLAAGPAGLIFVADRQGAEIFAVSADGARRSLARFTDGDAPRGLAFVPTTAETRAAGVAGDLLVAVIRSGTFQLNEIVRIAGPFGDLPARAPAPPTR